jgi:BirA family biotin operon repressor/biotin-[acetyl-CoA-carboxylase] ligase
MKWPNDIEIEGRKACGILVEIPPEHHRCVIGIGVNVNNTYGETDGALSQTAISLREATGQYLPLHRVLLKIICQTLRYMDRLAQDDPRLPALWQDDCNLVGKQVRIENGSARTQGLCRGIAKDGALLVDTRDGIQSFHSGSVWRMESL